MLHTMILRKNVRRETGQALIATNLDKTLQEFSAKAQSLPLITDEQRKFSFVQDTRFD